MVNCPPSSELPPKNQGWEAHGLHHEDFAFVNLGHNSCKYLNGSDCSMGLSTCSQHFHTTFRFVCLPQTPTYSEANAINADPALSPYAADPKLSPSPPSLSPYAADPALSPNFTFLWGCPSHGHERVKGASLGGWRS